MGTSAIATNQWGIELQGAGVDLTACQKFLQPVGDPFVEDVEHPEGNYLVLRSTKFDALTDKESVNRVGEALVEQLNVVMRATVDNDPVRAGAVVDFSPPSPPRRHHFLHAEGIELRVRLGHPELTLTDQHGNRVAQPPQPSEAQRWMKALSIDPDLAAAAHHLAGKPGYMELYKAYEALKKSNKASRAVSATEKNRFTHTANTGDNRHHTSNSPPSTPMSVLEARAMMHKWLEAAINETVP